LAAFIIVFSIFITSLSATVFKPTSIEKLSVQAKVIVRAEVLSVQSLWTDDPKQIYTEIQLRIIETYKGKSPETIVIRQLGGIVGEDALIVHGNAQFTPGEETLLFLTYQKGQYKTASLGLGKFSIIMENGQEVVENPVVSNRTLFIEKSPSLSQSHPKFLLDSVKLEIQKTR